MRYVRWDLTSATSQQRNIDNHLSHIWFLQNENIDNQTTCTVMTRDMMAQSIFTTGSADLTSRRLPSSEESVAIALSFRWLRQTCAARCRVECQSYIKHLSSVANRLVICTTFLFGSHKAFETNQRLRCLRSLYFVSPVSQRFWLTNSISKKVVRGKKASVGRALLMQDTALMACFRMTGCKQLLFPPYPDMTLILRIVWWHVLLHFTGSV